MYFFKKSFIFKNRRTWHTLFRSFPYPVSLTSLFCFSRLCSLSSILCEGWFQWRFDIWQVSVVTIFWLKDFYYFVSVSYLTECFFEVHHETYISIFMWRTLCANKFSANNATSFWCVVRFWTLFSIVVYSSFSFSICSFGIAQKVGSFGISSVLHTTLNRFKLSSFTQFKVSIGI